MPSYRTAKMASLVREIVSNAISHKLNDPRISPLASVVRVDLSGDLQIAKIYVSVLGPESESRRTIAALEHAASHIQRLLSRRLHARHTPELRFLPDEAVKGSMQTVKIIEESVRNDVRRQAKRSADIPPVAPGDQEGTRA